MSERLVVAQLRVLAGPHTVMGLWLEWLGLLGRCWEGEDRHSVEFTKRRLEKGKKIAESHGLVAKI